MAQWTNIDRWPDKDARNITFDVFKRLDELDWRAVGAKRDLSFNGEEEGLPYLRFGLDAQDLFVEWRTRHERRIRGGTTFILHWKAI